MKRPAFIAAQSRYPSGLVGLLVAAVMRRETVAANRAAIELLAAQPGERILDIGTGNGEALRMLAAIPGIGPLAGVDHSMLMCRRARRNNRQAIATGSVTVHCAGSDALPFDHSAFDAALALHTVYFWNPAEAHLAEIHRVLRPGGRLVVGFTAAGSAHAADFPDSVYTFRSADRIAGCLQNTGFDIGARQQRAGVTLQLAIASGWKSPT